MSCKIAALIAVASLCGIAGPAFGQPRIVASTPGQNGVVTNVTHIELTFNEKLGLAPAIALTMTGMPGMANHAPMKIAGFKTSLSPDGLKTALDLPRPLPAGTYALAWSATSASGESKGMIAFTAK